MISDQGTSPRWEDGLVIAAGRLFGVLDGVSAPYSYSYPAKMFNGMSGGEMVARLVEQFFGTIALSQYGAILFLPEQTLPEQELIEEILVANVAVREAQQNAGIDVENTEELAGACFAIAKINEATVEIVQVGDCMAVVELKNGEVIVTPNQVRLHEEEMNDEIERFQRAIAKDLFKLPLEEISGEILKRVREEMWDRFYPKNRKARRQRVNNVDNHFGFGLLNGQPQLADMLWKQTFERKEVATILLFSDGIVPWSTMKLDNDETIGQKVLSEFKQGGLVGLLLSAREEEKKIASTSYMDEAEATAISLDFSDEWR